MNVDVNELIKLLQDKLGEKEMQIIMLQLQLEKLQKQAESEHS